MDRKRNMTDKHILSAVFTVGGIASIAMLVLVGFGLVQDNGCPHGPTRAFWFCVGACGATSPSFMLDIGRRWAARRKRDGSKANP